MKNRHLYPDCWKVLSRHCRERADWKCEHCGIAQGAERVSRRGRLYKVVLQACHKDHTARHLEDADLLCLCAICHRWHDFEQDQLEQWRRLEQAKHARLISKDRIAQARARAVQRAALAKIA